MHRLIAFVLHATAAGIMTWGWFGFLDEPTSESMMRMARKGGYSLFATHQGLVMACSCMVISLFCDVFPSVAVARHVKRLFMMVAMPVSFAISSIYWSLLCFVPHLIVPVPTTTVSEPTPGPVPRLPLSIDLALHAAPFLTLMIDFFVFEPKFSKAYANKVAPVALGVFGFWYSSFVEYCAPFNGSFPYPFLNNPFAIRVLIYIAATGITLGYFSTLNALHA